MPTRLARKQAIAGDDLNLRERAEKQVACALKVIIRQSSMPAARQMVPGNLADHRFAKGRRASTLRKHVKTWNTAARWFKCTYDIEWPRHVHEVVAYPEARLAEPCARTAPEIS